MIDLCKTMVTFSFFFVHSIDIFMFSLMPITKYKLHKTSLQDSANLNVSNSMETESTPSVTTTTAIITTTVPENNHKRQRIESSESTINVIPSTERLEEQPRKKKIKPKPIDDQVSQSSAVIQSKPEPPPTVLLKPSVPSSPQVTIEKEMVSEEAPVSQPSTNGGRIRELKSKTPAWKPLPPAPRGNPERNSNELSLLINLNIFLDKIHIRFDSDSDEEVSSSHQTPSIIEEKQKIESPLPHTNGSNSSVCIEYTPRSSLPSSDENNSKKKTIDLLFEMKQHKNPEEKLGKRIQQKHGRRREQNRKRALDYFSMANFVDQAFGLNKEDLEKQIASSNEYHTSSSSTPQVNSIRKMNDITDN
mgnify:CR=1 FL=1